MHPSFPCARRCARMVNEDLKCASQAVDRGFPTIVRSRRAASSFEFLQNGAGIGHGAGSTIPMAASASMAALRRASATGRDNADPASPGGCRPQTAKSASAADRARRSARKHEGQCSGGSHSNTRSRCAGTPRPQRHRTAGSASSRRSRSFQPGDDASDWVPSGLEEGIDDSLPIVAQQSDKTLVRLALREACRKRPRRRRHFSLRAR